MSEKLLNSTLDVLINSFDSGIIVICDDLTVINFNKWLEINTQFNKEGIIGQDISTVFKEIKIEVLKRKIKSALDLNTTTFYEPNIAKKLFPMIRNNVIHTNIDKMEIKIHITPLDIKKRQVIIHIYDVSEIYELQEELNKELKKIKKINDGMPDAIKYNHNELIDNNFSEKLLLEKYSKKDPLTGEYNRLMYDVVMDEKLSSNRKLDKQISLIGLGINNFKEMNKKFGIKAGDNFLIDIVSKIKNIIRAEDVLIRYFEDQFLILLFNTSFHDTSIKCKELEAELYTHTFDGIDDFSFKMSVIYYRENETKDDFLNRAINFETGTCKC